MRWNKAPKAPRPEYPKLVAIAATSEQVRDLLPLIQESDPDAILVDGGDRRLYARVHNDAAEAAAKAFTVNRSFPLA